MAIKKLGKDYTLEQFTEAVKASYSKAGVLKQLNLDVSGGNYKTVDNLVKKFKLDTSHWTGQGHLRGKRCEWSKSSYETKDLLTENNTFQTFKLKQRLLKEGIIQNKCTECGVSDWNGKTLNMHLDHINGINNDHRLENLRMLCPNCHSQTDTYCGKNKKSS